MSGNYKPNSHKYKMEQAQSLERDKRVDKVISGKAKIKQNEARKLKDIFIPGDVANVKTYMFMDVFVPAIKKAISDVVRNGIDMILYGETERPREKAPYSRVSYGSFYGRGDEIKRRSNETIARHRQTYEDINLETRGEAEDVLATMDDLIERYGVVRVADLYDMIDVTGEFTDNNYGWTNLRNASVVRTRDGYTLKLPKAMPIDN